MRSWGSSAFLCLNTPLHIGSILEKSPWPKPIRVPLLPRVKECTVQQCAIVVVPHKVGHIYSPGTRLRLVVGLHLDLVLWIPDIQQQHIKMQHRIRWDDVTCGKRNMNLWANISLRAQPMRFLCQVPLQEMANNGSDSDVLSHTGAAPITIP